MVKRGKQKKDLKNSGKLWTYPPSHLQQEAEEGKNEKKGMMSEWKTEQAALSSKRLIQREEKGLGFMLRDQQQPRKTDNSITEKEGGFKSGAMTGGAGRTNGKKVSTFWLRSFSSKVYI